MKQRGSQLPVMGNAKVLRNVNRSLILNIIREKAPVSRVEIARMTGLNKSTVSSIVPELIDGKLIYEEVKQDKNVGRNPIYLRLRLDEHFVGAISIESQTTSLAVSDIDGDLKHAVTLKTEAADPARFLKQVLEQLVAIQQISGVRNLRGVGISIQGIVNSREARVDVSSQLGWKNVDIGDIVKKICGEKYSIIINNDANAMALAELWFGKHELKLNNFISLYIGEGIGCGIVLDRKIFEGAHHASGEFGHMTIAEGSEQCYCGSLGCWEAFASNRALVKRYCLEKGRRITFDESISVDSIARAARNGEAAAQEALLKTGYYLGIGISNIVKLLDPAAIVMVGDITRTFDIIHDEIMNTVYEKLTWGNKHKIHILPGSVSCDPRLLGAATLAIQEIFRDFKIVL